MKKEFVKYDQDKNMLSLIEPPFVEGIGRVLTIGAKKYSPDNWKKLPKEETWRYKDAMLRHIYAYLNGEKLDQETGESHLYHAACCMMFLDYYDKKEIE